MADPISPGVSFNPILDKYSQEHNGSQPTPAGTPAAPPVRDPATFADNTDILQEYSQQAAAQQARDAQPKSKPPAWSGFFNSKVGKALGWGLQHSSLSEDVRWIPGVAKAEDAIPGVRTALDVATNLPALALVASGVGTPAGLALAAAGAGAGQVAGQVYQKAGLPGGKYAPTVGSIVGGIAAPEALGSKFEAAGDAANAFSENASPADIAARTAMENRIENNGEVMKGDFLHSTTEPLPNGSLPEDATFSPRIPEGAQPESITTSRVEDPSHFVYDRATKTFKYASPEAAQANNIPSELVDATNAQKDADNALAAASERISRESAPPVEPTAEEPPAAPLHTESKPGLFQSVMKAVVPAPVRLAFRGLSAADNAVANIAASIAPDIAKPVVQYLARPSTVLGAYAITHPDEAKAAVKKAFDINSEIGAKIADTLLPHTAFDMGIPGLHHINVQGMGEQFFQPLNLAMLGEGTVGKMTAEAAFKMGGKTIITQEMIQQAARWGAIGALQTWAEGGSNKQIALSFVQNGANAAAMAGKGLGGYAAATIGTGALTAGFTLAQGGSKDQALQAGVQSGAQAAAFGLVPHLTEIFKPTLDLMNGKKPEQAAAIANEAGKIVTGTPLRNENIQSMGWSASPQVSLAHEAISGTHPELFSPEAQPLLAQIVHNTLVPDGGSSTNIHTLEGMKEGYGLSIFPERTQVIPTEEFTKHPTYYLERFTQLNKDLLDSPDKYLGTWHEGDTKNISLDVSINVTDEAEAYSLMKEHNQKSMYRVSDGAIIENPDYDPTKGAEAAAAAQGNAAPRSDEEIYQQLTTSPAANADTLSRELIPVTGNEPVNINSGDAVDVNPNLSTFPFVKSTDWLPAADGYEARVLTAKRGDNYESRIWVRREGANDTDGVVLSGMQLNAMTSNPGDIDGQIQNLARAIKNGAVETGIRANVRQVRDRMENISDIKDNEAIRNGTMIEGTAREVPEVRQLNADTLSRTVTSNTDFISQFDAQHGTNDGEGVLGSTEVKLVPSDLPGHQDAVLLDWIGARTGTEEGTGSGSKALDAVLDMSDKTGVPVVLQAEAKGGLSQSDLDDWYFRHGFETDPRDDTVMVYEPGSERGEPLTETDKQIRALEREKTQLEDEAEEASEAGEAVDPDTEERLGDIDTELARLSSMRPAAEVLPRESQPAQPNEEQPTGEHLNASRIDLAKVPYDQLRQAQVEIQQRGDPSVSPLAAAIDREVNDRIEPHTIETPAGKVEVQPYVPERYTTLLSQVQELTSSGQDVPADVMSEYLAQERARRVMTREPNTLDVEAEQQQYSGGDHMVGLDNVSRAREESVPHGPDEIVLYFGTNNTSPNTEGGRFLTNRRWRADYYARTAADNGGGEPHVYTVVAKRDALEPYDILYHEDQGLPEYTYRIHEPGGIRVVSPEEIKEPQMAPAAEVIGGLHDNNPAQKIRLTHYSNKALDIIDPQFAGSGHGIGTELQVGGPPVSHYYVEGTQPERMIHGIPHTVEVNRSSIMDMNSVAGQEVVARARENATAAGRSVTMGDIREEAMKQGYLGLTNSHAPSNPHNIVQLFQAMRPVEVNGKPLPPTPDSKLERLPLPAAEVINRTPTVENGVATVSRRNVTAAPRGLILTDGKTASDVYGEEYGAGAQQNAINMADALRKKLISAAGIDTTTLSQHAVGGREQHGPMLSGGKNMLKIVDDRLDDYIRSLPVYSKSGESKISVLGEKLAVENLYRGELDEAEQRAWWNEVVSRYDVNPEEALFPKSRTAKKYVYDPEQDKRVSNETVSFAGLTPSEELYSRVVTAAHKSMANMYYNLGHPITDKDGKVIFAGGYGLPNQSRIAKLMTSAILQDPKSNLWYEGIQRWAYNKFGKSDGQLFVNLIAATSQQKSPIDNLRLALNAFADYKMGYYENGSYRSGGVFDQMNKNIRAVIAGELPTGAKINSFAHNLSLDDYMVTNDRWMFRIFGFPDTSSEATYSQVAQMIRLISSDYGMTPREAQALLWLGARLETNPDLRGFNNIHSPNASYEAMLDESSNDSDPRAIDILKNIEFMREAGLIDYPTDNEAAVAEADANSARSNSLRDAVANASLDKARSLADQRGIQYGATDDALTIRDRIYQDEVAEGRQFTSEDRKLDDVAKQAKREKLLSLVEAGGQRAITAQAELDAMDTPSALDPHVVQALNDWIEHDIKPKGTILQKAHLALDTFQKVIPNLSPTDAHVMVNLDRRVAPWQKKLLLDEYPDTIQYPHPSEFTPELVERLRGDVAQMRERELKSKNTKPAWVNPETGDLRIIVPGFSTDDGIVAPDINPDGFDSDHEHVSDEVLNTTAGSVFNDDSFTFAGMTPREMREQSRLQYSSALDKASEPVRQALEARNAPQLNDSGAKVIASMPEFIRNMFAIWNRDGKPPAWKVISQHIGEFYNETKNLRDTVANTQYADQYALVTQKIIDALSERYRGSALDMGQGFPKFGGLNLDPEVQAMYIPGRGDSVATPQQGSIVFNPLGAVTQAQYARKHFAWARNLSDEELLGRTIAMNVNHEFAHDYAYHGDKLDEQQFQHIFHVLMSHPDFQKDVDLATAMVRQLPNNEKDLWIQHANSHQQLRDDAELSIDVLGKLTRPGGTGEPGTEHLPAEHANGSANGSARPGAEFPSTSGIPNGIAGNGNVRAGRAGNVRQPTNGQTEQRGTVAVIRGANAQHVNAERINAANDGSTNGLPADTGSWLNPDTGRREPVAAATADKRGIPDTVLTPIRTYRPGTDPRLDAAAGDGKFWVKPPANGNTVVPRLTSVKQAINEQFSDNWMRRMGVRLSQNKLADWGVKLIGGHSAAATEDYEKAMVVANRYAQEGRSRKGMLMTQLRAAIPPFPRVHSETGNELFRVTTVDGRTVDVTMGDLVEQQGNYQLTQSQQGFIKLLGAVRSELVQEYLDAGGDPKVLNRYTNPNYFPRSVASDRGYTFEGGAFDYDKQGQRVVEAEGNGRPTTKRALGAKQAFERKRQYQTQADGIRNGIVYAPWDTAMEQFIDQMNYRTSGLMLSEYLRSYGKTALQLADSRDTVAADKLEESRHQFAVAQQQFNKGTIDANTLKAAEQQYTAAVSEYNNTPKTGPTAKRTYALLNLKEAAQKVAGVQKELKDAVAARTKDANSMKYRMPSYRDVVARAEKHDEVRTAKKVYDKAVRDNLRGRFDNSAPEDQKKLATYEKRLAVANTQAKEVIKGWGQGSDQAEQIRFHQDNLARAVSDLQAAAKDLNKNTLKGIEADWRVARMQAIADEKFKMRGDREDVLDAHDQNIDSIQKRLQSAKDELVQARVTGAGIRQTSSSVVQQFANSRTIPGEVFDPYDQLGLKGDIVPVKSIGMQAPSLTGRLFPAHIADAINESLLDQSESGHPAFKPFQNANNWARAFMTSTDFGHFFLQGLPVLATNPVAWGRAVYLGLRTGIAHDPQFWSRYIRDNWEYASESFPYIGFQGGTEYHLADSGSIPARLVNSEGQGLAGTVKRGAGNLLMRPAVNFETFLDAAKLELWKGMRPYMLDASGNLDHVKAEAYGRLIRNLTGTTDTSRLGLPRQQRLIESFLMFSPRFTRSVFALTGQALQGGIAGRRAQASIATLLGGAALMFFGVKTGLYQAGVVDSPPTLEDFDPTNGGKFMSIRIGNNYYGIGGSFRGAVQLLGGVVASAKNPQNLVTLDTQDNPFLKYARSRLSPAASQVVDFATGKTVTGEDTTDRTAWLMKLPDNYLPFGVSSLSSSEGGIADKIGAFTATALGGRTFPESVSTQFNDSVVAALKQPGAIEGIDPQERSQIKGWADLTTMQRNNLLHAHPELLQQLGQKQAAQWSQFLQLSDEAETAKRSLGQRWALTQGKLLQNPNYILTADDLNSKDYRSALDTINQKLSAARDALDNANIFSGQGGTTFSTPANTHRQQVMQAYDQYVNPSQYLDPATGAINFDVRDQLEQDFLAQLTPADQQIVKEETAGTSLDPVEDRLKQAKSLLRPYFDIRNEVASQLGYATPLDLTNQNNKKLNTDYNNLVAAAEDQMRRQNPDIDKALVLWGYVSTPITAQKTSGSSFLNKKGISSSTSSFLTKKGIG